ncbi:hypothetical protein J6590_076006 [Homalodisca vitripennis]|nr:hypothetical protein J6590_076006 [Homalodisca vitripennis]
MQGHHPSVTDQVQHITTVTLVWLWSRHDLTDYLKPFVTALLLLCSYKPLLMDLLVQKDLPWKTERLETQNNERERGNS